VGTHAGPLGDIPATGRKASNRGCTVVEIKNAKAAHAWVYFDNAQPAPSDRCSASALILRSADAAPNPASDHMRVATHSSRATATKIPVISAPMIFAIAVPSSV